MRLLFKPNCIQIIKLLERKIGGHGISTLADIRKNADLIVM